MDEAQALAALDADTKDSIAGVLWLPAFEPAEIPAEIRAKLAHPKNSNEAFGERMRYRLQYMIDNPDSFTPSYQDRYDLLMAHAGALSPHQAYAMTARLGMDSSKGYQRMPEEANFTFPEAHGEQLRTQVGWYFFVGSCRGRNGKEYGVELMFFRYALLPWPAAQAFGLSDIENQVVELQFAISEAGERHYQAKPVVVAGTTGLLDYRPNQIYVHQGKNVAEQDDPGSTFPLRFAARGTYAGEGEPVELGVDISIASGKAPLLQGEQGCAPCCSGVGTLYYSYPGLMLDPAKSRLWLKGEEVELTEGTFWFDHQWATGMIPGGSPRSHVMRAAAAAKPGVAVAGWDWFEAQFIGDRQITCHNIHSAEFINFYHQTGPEPPGTMTVTLNGKYMDEHKQQHDITGTLSISGWIRSTDTPDPSQYPPTNTWYPNRWEFTFGDDVPEEIRRFTMTPIVPNGQSAYFAFGGHYSEGAVYLTDPSDRDIGRGFAESVMYADSGPTITALAGLPDTEEVRALFDVKPSTALRLQSIAYLAMPPHVLQLKQSLEGCVKHGLLTG